MTDEEILTYRARQRAAGEYRAEGYSDFAERVERGECDDCPQMRVARFFIFPPRPHDAAFIAAWDELVGGLGPQIASANGYASS